MAETSYMPTFSPETWAHFQAIADRDCVPDPSWTFERLQTYTDERIRTAESAGDTVKRYAVDVTDLEAWCHRNGLCVGRSALYAYVRCLLDERPAVKH